MSILRSLEQVVVASPSEIHEAGKPFMLHATYVTERLDKVSVPKSDNIKWNNMLAFANRLELMKQYSKDANLQRPNMILVVQIFILLHSCQDARMADFLLFANLREPPSLADGGSLRVGKKSDILQCLSATTGRVVATKQQATAAVLDVAAIIHVQCRPDEQGHPAST